MPPVPLGIYELTGIGNEETNLVAESTRAITLKCMLGLCCASSRESSVVRKRMCQQEYAGTQRCKSRNASCAFRRSS